MVQRDMCLCSHSARLAFATNLSEGRFHCGVLLMPGGPDGNDRVEDHFNAGKLVNFLVDNIVSTNGRISTDAVLFVFFLISSLRR